MAFQTGDILDGRVTGITKFGAFVALPDGKSGLVHISEVANAFVADVNDYVQVGQSVKVKVLSVSPEGKINLSMKKAVPAEAAQPERPRPQPPHREAPRPAPVQQAAPPTADQAFEDRLKKFMQESDSRIADNRIYADRSRSRRRK